MWFRKQKGEKTPPHVIQPKIGLFLTGLQQRWADLLSAKERSLTTGQKKIYCIVFCLLFGGASFYIVLHTLLATAPLSSQALKAAHISRPVPLPSNAIRWSKRDSITVVHFRKWIDSLASGKQGRQVLDSFYRMHPQFVDSFLEMEATIFQP